MQPTVYASLAKLRLLVGVLGEQGKHNWWPTTFFSSSSRIFLEPIFPKTLPLSQYHGVLEAARRIHDDRLNVGSFHLFRLPEEAEQDLHALVASWSSADVADLLGQDADSAMAALGRMASDKGESAMGPISCGAVQTLLSGDVVSRIASIYQRAFDEGVQAYPYFAGEA